MQISISNTGITPIYEQIVAQVKASILKGELTPGEMLPSMRALAKELRISVITTKRAYEELEREGLIVSHTGRGSFVAEGNHEKLREARYRELEADLISLIRFARETGLTLEEFTDLAATFYYEEG